MNSLKLNNGFPYIFNKSRNDEIRRKTNESKLFYDADGLHYQLQYQTSNVDTGQFVENQEYLIKRIDHYDVDEEKIEIQGEISMHKQSQEGKSKNVNKVTIYRVYSNEDKLLDILENKLKKSEA